MSRLPLRLAAALPLLVIAIACGSSSTEQLPGSDAGPDGAVLPDASGGPDSSPSDGASSDSSGEGGACSAGVAKPKTGETCIGFGKKDPCNAACGEYGYVCFGGGPPNIDGCLQVTSSTLGETYCCAKNTCVAEPDQDSKCAGVSGKPHRFQCPPDGTGSNVAPPPSCVEKDSGGTELEKFFCCP